MATDRLVLVMALEFQLPRLGGCDLSAQSERRAHVPRHTKWPALAYQNTVVSRHVSLATAFRYVRLVGLLQLSSHCQTDVA
jgi:hypothetical protein